MQNGNTNMTVIIWRHSEGKKFVVFFMSDKIAKNKKQKTNMIYKKNYEVHALCIPLKSNL